MKSKHELEIHRGKIRYGVKNFVTSTAGEFPCRCRRCRS